MTIIDRPWMNWPVIVVKAVCISFGVLRSYLIVMTLMLGYHVLELAGVLHKIR